MKMLANIKQCKVQTRPWFLAPAGGIVESRRFCRNGRFLRSQDSPEFCEKAKPLFRLALPYSDHAPAKVGKLTFDAAVPPYISIKFLFPILDIALRHGSFGAVLMPVPETAMHENHGSVFRQDDIGIAGKIVPVEPEPKTVPMKEPAHQQFGSRIGGANFAHYFAPLFS
jgi:hypothetical protein